MTQSRDYEWGTAGRLDVDGVVWYACEPYPTWYRWDDNSILITPEGGTPVWAE